jgi:signal peptidase I
MITGERTDRFLAMLEEALDRGCVVHFRAAGSSMLPTIKSGDVVAVTPCNGLRLRAGEIVLCRIGPRGLVLHRVAEVGAGSTVLIRGDAPTAEPERVTGAAVLGKAIGVVEGERLRSLTGRLARWRVMAARGRHHVRQWIGTGGRY